METTADKLRAFGLSVAVHLGVLAVITLGVIWTKSTVTYSLPGPVIEATLVGPPKTVKPQNVKLKPKPAEPTPPKPQEEAKPEQAPEPPKEDKKDQERVTEMLAAQAAEEKRVQEEKRKK
ncbi:MAG TPA: cell envelope integrity protein TolA, partial [Tahibacter sp.]|nr:cell envelope integrity protein TolA [Tahibacter sp.]